MSGETSFYVWRPLATGENGSTCLATDKEGNACVIKFYNHVDSSSLEETTEAVTKEYKHWEDIYLRNKDTWSFCGLKTIGE